MEFEILENGMKIRRCMLKMIKQFGEFDGHRIVGKLIHSPPSVVSPNEFSDVGIVERGKQYSLSVPNRIELNGKKYRFIKWSDGVRSAQRDIDAKTPYITLKAYYVREKEIMIWPISHANPQRTRALDVAIPSIDPSNPEIIWQIPCGVCYFTDPLIADVNNDGENELILIDSSKSLKIYIIKNGKKVKVVDSSEFGHAVTYGVSFSGACIDDIDGDGKNEFMFLFWANDFSCHLIIMRFHEDNSYEILIDKKISCCSSGILPIDLDNDGVKEILMLASGNHDANDCQSRLGYYDWKEDKLMKIDLPDDRCAGSYSNLVSIKDNYIVVTGINYVFVGELKDLISSVKLTKLGNVYGSQPILEDVDGDGSPEIILGGAYLYTVSTTSSFLGPVNLYVLKLDGSIVWEAEKATISSYPGSCISLADVDGDGNDEVIAVSSNGILVFEASTGKVKFSKYLSVGGRVSVTVGDVNNDGQLEIVRSFEGGINVWNPLTDKLWSVNFNGSANSLAIGDVDNDDQLEIIVTTFSPSYVYVIKFR